jgi:hypothetical protein
MPFRSPLLFALLTLAVLGVSGPGRADTLVLDDGGQVRGTLLSVQRGWVEFQPTGGEETGERLRLAVAEVRAIRFDDGGERATDRPLGDTAGGGDRAQAAETDAGPRDRRITVSARQRWTDTGIDVTMGDVVSFSASGRVTIGDDRPLGAEGDLDGAAAAPRRPLTDRPPGALIGRIGTSPDDTFFIGAEKRPFRVRTSGRLYLAVNDDSLGDDTGAFQVAVTR